MSWHKGQHRTEDEIIRISEGVRRYYSAPRYFGIARKIQIQSTRGKIAKLYTYGNMFKVYDQFMQAALPKKSLK